jgi:hypothetical protein
VLLEVELTFCVNVSVMGSGLNALYEKELDTEIILFILMKELGIIFDIILGNVYNLQRTS